MKAKIGLIGIIAVSLAVGSVKDLAAEQTSKEQARPAGVEETVIDYKNDVIMSYRIEGGYSPYKFAEVVVKETGEVICHFDYLGMEGKITRKLTKEERKKFLNLYEKADFLNMEFPERMVIDVGKTTLFFKDGKKEKQVTYQIAENKKNNQLSKECWKIITAEKCLLELNNYKSIKETRFVNSLSEARYLDKESILNSKELEKIVTEIAVDKEVGPATRQIAIGALVNIGSSDAGPSLIVLLNDPLFYESYPFAGSVLEAIHAIGDYRIVDPLINVLADNAHHPHYRRLAMAAINRITKQSFKFDAYAPAEEQEAAIKEIRNWWAENKEKFR